MDDRERQTFLELQMKLVDHTNKLKTVRSRSSLLQCPDSCFAPRPVGPLVRVYHQCTMYLGCLRQLDE